MKIETMDSRRAFLRGVTNGGGDDDDEDFFSTPVGSANPFISVLERPRRNDNTKPTRKQTTDRKAAVRDFKEDTKEEADIDDLESVRTASPPPALRVADIALRNDPFALFLSEACGVCSLSLADCFHTYPPDHCRTYNSYRHYLNPSPRAAIAKTAKWIRDITKGRRTFDECIGFMASPNLITAVSEVVGQYMRKHIMDNPIKTTHTKVASGILNHDLMDALEMLYHELKEKWEVKRYELINHEFEHNTRKIKTGI